MDLVGKTDARDWPGIRVATSSQTRGLKHDLVRRAAKLSCESLLGECPSLPWFRAERAPASFHSGMAQTRYRLPNVRQGVCRSLRPGQRASKHPAVDGSRPTASSDLGS